MATGEKMSLLAAASKDSYSSHSPSNSKSNTNGSTPPRQGFRPALAALSLLGCLWTGSLVAPSLYRLPQALTLARANPHGNTSVPLTDILLSTPSNDSAAAWLYYYTSGPHLAGQNYSQALWTRDRWAEWGADTDIVAYDLYINYPVDHSLKLLTKSADADAAAPWTVAFEAVLEEDVIPEDETTALANRVPTFHGYSASGNVTGPLVYVNYGTFADYEDLERANVSLVGAIAIARYGGIFRGLKVKRAQELGAVGVLIYSDPGDDHDITEDNGYAAYPAGPARHPSSVQRGSVQFLNIGPGDPTTPGRPSKPGVPRGPTDAYIPSIPSLPISYTDALPLLRALNGHGPSAHDLGPYWDRRLGLVSHGVDYNVGPTAAGAVEVQLVNEQEYTTTPIWDVVGVFNGSVLPNEVVVVGNHRDAWIAGGAVDPNSGSAVLNEVIRAFGVAYAAGWRPVRTIVFASWDGEEYGLLGSTEWVEDYLPWLTVASLAYINMDVGVAGPNFGANAAPLLHHVLRNVTAAILSPNQTVPGQTIADDWDGHIGTLGSGSDYTAFLDHAGIPSVDLGFGEGTPVYQYHSNYDSYYWMAHYGDPGFAYHKTAAQLLGLLVGRFASDPVVPFRAADYAAALQSYVDKVRSQLARHGDPTATAAYLATLSADEQIATRGVVSADAADTADSEFSIDDMKTALDRLDAAVAAFTEPAEAIDAKADELRAGFASLSSSSSSSSSSSTTLAFLLPGFLGDLLGTARRIWLALQTLSVNKKYQQLERAFLYDDGLDGRDWFKHIIFAPGIWTGYAGAVFPGLVESIDAGNWTNAFRWAAIIENHIQIATHGL